MGIWVSSRVKVRVIVLAAQGCIHAQAVVQAVTQQLHPGEELLVIEDNDCAEALLTKPNSGATLVHLATGKSHDFELAVEGISKVIPGARQPELYLVLEDHAVPSPMFMENLREFFTHKERQGTTFFTRNGTPIDAPSKALYAYVCGLADVESRRGAIEPVTSSFAITAQAIGGLSVEDKLSAENRGWLQYIKVPELMRDPINQPPKELYVFHCQVNTFAQASSAIYWNARSNAVIDGNSVSLVQAAIRMPIKYLVRSVHVLMARPQDVRTSCMVFALGVCGYAGWWVGRFKGDTGAAEKIAAAHPVAATKRD